ncbi:chromosome segregation protein SMC [bacterium E08(2017)]|nr:chromosome segregation protein SMC [bacterium E08(2017)]
MYLKSVELVGFKSFANKTKVDIEPGMTCIVGPNGCGKSNISDCIRWVLGEQSAKALRGSNMADVIFNGTDDLKALGMAEVSITLADCESSIDIGFDEVTVTRRVFRSGEGQYFINKSPCRLKDIQRLFMDTGIGTTSYSMMEQGRIDRVLSSRPEDRREIFEEASGITRFKADKKEAIRKLDHTEANLLRLADVIREVKRQIGSLQRQAGKARRYKEFRDELRKLDIYATKIHLKNSDASISDIESKISKLNSSKNSFTNEIDELEETNRKARDELMKIERDIGTVAELSVQAQSKLDHTHEMITLNHQRIEEYKNLSDKDSQEISDISRQLEDHKNQCERLAESKNKAAEEERVAEEQLSTSNHKFSEHQQQIDSARDTIVKLREEQVELESTVSRLRNQIVEIESQERSSVIQRERLAAEKTQLSRILSGHEEKLNEASSALDELRKTVAEKQLLLTELEGTMSKSTTELNDCKQESASLESAAAGCKARIDLLSEEQATAGFPEGAKLLLDESNPLSIDSNAVIGALADHVTANDGYAQALEATLRAWLDAVILSDSSKALDILKILASRNEGSARLLISNPSNALSAVSAPDSAEPLINHIQYTPTIKPILDAMLGNVFIIESLETVPSSPGATFVTRNGAVINADGTMEFWSTESQPSNPLSRKNALASEQHRLAELEENRDSLKNIANNLEDSIQSLTKDISNARAELDAQRQTTAQKEGELQVIQKETEAAREHLATATYELESLTNQDESAEENRNTLSTELNDARKQQERISGDIATQTTELRKLEERHGEIQADVTDKRVHYSTISQSRQHLEQQFNAVNSRLSELEDALKGRSDGFESHKNMMERLTSEISGAKERLGVLEKEVIEHNTKADRMRESREQQAADISKNEQNLSAKRAELEEVRSSISDLEIRLTENKMKRQNTAERVTADYSLTLEQVMEEAEPEWDGDAPSIESVETNVAELRTKLDAMGPVNLVAIEEYKELEERYNFLTQQEEDLTKAKQQLIDMIKQINRTTSEMFRSTFDQVNTNFQDMFKQLFDGGSAKLVLINEEDVLDCGIEIIARPPGKRLQNISLLSGGERTMTAVALLFAIYMIKPSPFCLLDELDAALDDSNIGRFVKVLKGFVNQSQFLIITHNQHTIAAANAIYGVTMPKKGVSTIVSMKFKEAADIAG